MAFKTGTFAQNLADNPAGHFKTLTKRQYPDVMPHQKEILEAYAARHQTSADLALQLPTGSGKTLVGLLIADWRRAKFRERVVYLCPTKQLVAQTVQQAKDRYGIDAVALAGAKDRFPPADTTAYRTGSAVAVTTYSGLFNTHPFFDDPDLILIDDAHAAENYIAGMWSMTIDAGTPLHAALAEYLKPHLEPQDYSRLIGDWSGSADATWVEKLPSPQVDELSAEMISIIDAYARDGDLYFKWTLLRSHLDACHVYLGSREILIRPLIPPTMSHGPFHRAKQRIFMSATLGAGGDLERLSGRRKIERLPAPEGFQSAGVGRRFFVFPSLSLTGDETEILRVAMQKRAGRSVVLTPSSPQADEHVARIDKDLVGFEVFTAEDIEADKTPFVSSDNAVAVLANRYDGIDFPGDECRLLSVDGLPRAMNAQERFIMSKMGAGALYNDRIQTRVLQAVGRCTRALQDRSSVFVTGTELVDFLADNRKWRYFSPELQAELAFGVDQSTSVAANDMLDNFDMFLRNDAGWAGADATIRTSVKTYVQQPYPAMGELAAVVAHEVQYQEAMWSKDWAGALGAARSVLAGLNHEDLRGYRALWHYLAGAAARRLSAAPEDAQAAAAREQFGKAKTAAPAVSWLNTLARIVGPLPATEAPHSNVELLKQVESLERQFLAMGMTTHHKFEKRAAAILTGLNAADGFEQAQVDLGKLLGFSCGNDESDAAPDPWWLGDKFGLVFEDHADGSAGTVFGAVKARQASSHPKWIRKNVPGAGDMDICPVLLTPSVKATSGADPQLDDVKYWELSDFRKWASAAVATIRSLKDTFPGEGDLLWRAEAAERLEAEGLTLAAILRRLPIASEAMEIIG
ncbi:DEAD/DEAH box type DNA/RNA helicase protein [Rhizobium sp. NXC14]|uniref:DEAD/DEAH box helicase n=1 Tax=Rhizobium sp. NXC14 TaxID=1981173 RepID=UPI000A2029A7|nr:DEAD/DEAH box helicase [Rhizobium sp. NXC14]ARO31718.1 DEAD/DEAH box type DNA/RNA helicase protein [Rhizobium sp. NXC14]